MQRVIKIDDRAVSSILFSNELIIILLLVPFFKTTGFDFMPGLSSFANAMIAIEFFVFALLDVFERRITKFSGCIILLEFWIYIFAPIISKAERPSFFYLMGALGLISFFEIGFSANPQKVMNATVKLFTIMISINGVMVAVKPAGFFITKDGTSCFLFGIRTGFSLFIIPAIMFSLIRDKYKGKISIYTIIIFLIGGFSLVNQWVATGIIEMFIIVVLLLVMRNSRIAEKINLIFVLVLLFIVDIIITVFGSENILLNFISKALNKDVTLSGRIEIWNKVLQKLESSPLAGVGKDAVVQIGMTYRPAHNQWLHTAMEGGYVAMIIFIVAIFISCKYLFSNKCKKWYTVCAIPIIAILVGSLTEIQTYVPFFYAVFEIPFLLEIWDYKLEKGIVKHDTLQS